MDKILFIVPPHISFNQFINPSYNERIVHKKYGSFGSVLTDMPLGVLSLSAYAKKHIAVETKLIDFNIVLNKLEGFEFRSFSEFFHDFLSSPTWVDYAPSIIGISALFTPSYQSMLDIAQCCRDIFPDAVIIAGGGVPTNMYKEIFSESTCFDALCYGEGEKPLLSVESGSNRVLKEIMHKPFNLSIVKRVADDCRGLGIYTNVNVLIGLPGETKKDIEDARVFLKTINANWFLIFCANPLVGSEMYDICKKKKYIKGNFIGSDYKKAIVETEDFTAEYIQEMVYFLNLELNFVYNSDFRLGNYGMALKGFENAIRAKNDHAIAYYYAAKCYEKLGNLEKAQQYMNTAKMNATEKSFGANT